MLKVYLGAPIDQTSDDPTKNFKYLKEILQKLVPERFVAYDPLNAFVGAAFAKTKDTRAYVVDINMEAVEGADLGLFVWDGNPSFGVPVEIMKMTQEDIPFIIYASGKTGIYLKHLVEEGSSLSRMTHSREKFEHYILEHFDGGKSTKEPNSPEVEKTKEERAVSI